ncbi:MULTISPECIES: DUF4148 domain-containing protein [unclassified Paraburkholderia]|uniref:DUF4148 domain-containing protein n=1 Tax=unclassified Paraburkholderia TaxID=2615204 RepID=UPI0020B6990C|nr:MULTISPECIES: DUF4148 domain-containing protein [unclassified Paraburkholderia]MCP3721024.1 hypothetical protein [Paraburkholderia sp. CNPSo 3281]MCX5544711.1 hypothetical protein [Paraburkholderia sp. CNPSo 3076]
MKALMIIAALAGVVTATSAFAQTPAPTAGTQASQPAAATQIAANDTAPTVAPGGWVPPYGQAVHEKTRAEVYHELVQAAQDGQLAYLNSTLYAH